MNKISSSSINVTTDFISALQQLPFDNLKKISGNDVIASLFDQGQNVKNFGSQSFIQELSKSIIQSLKNHFWHFWWERYDVSTPFQYYGNQALTARDPRTVFAKAPENPAKKSTFERNKRTYNILLKIAELENDPNYSFENFSLKLNEIGKKYKWSNKILQETGNIGQQKTMDDFLLYENRTFFHILLCQDTNEISFADDLYSQKGKLIPGYSKDTDWFEQKEFNLFLESIWGTFSEIKKISPNVYNQQTAVFDLMRELKEIQHIEQDALCLLETLNPIECSVSLHLERNLSESDKKTLKNIDVHKEDLWEFIQQVENCVKYSIYPTMLQDQKTLQTVFFEGPNIFTQPGQEINSISLPRNSYGNDVYDLQFEQAVPVICVNNMGNFCITSTQIMRAIFDFDKCITFFPLLSNAQRDIDRFNIGKNNVRLVCSAPVNGAQKHQTMLTIIKEYFAEIKKEFDKVAKASAKKGLANKGKKGRK